MEWTLFSVAVIAGLLSYSYVLHRNKVMLVIGILSAQNNSERRQAVRDTWINLIKGDARIKYYFVIGSEVCPVHPSDRSDEWSCENWQISLPKDCCVLSSGAKNVCDSATETFLFRVQHAVILLGMQISCPSVFYRINNHPTLCKVIVTDAVSGQRLTSATVETHETDLIHNQSLHTPLLLHASYEVRVNFQIRTNTEEQSDTAKLNASPLAPTPQFSWGADGGVLRLLEPAQNGSCLPISLKYAVSDVSRLQQHIKTATRRRLEYSHKVKTLQDQLASEQHEFGDIAFVPVTDTYRNLPLKLLAFFKWLKEQSWATQPHFVMKTDDDVFVDTRIVMQELTEKASKSWTWWGSFREGWKPQSAGKWREPAPHPWKVYPPFPCGGGYVLSWDLVERVIYKSQQQEVHMPQGEDVSMGVWLEDAQVWQHKGPCIWECTYAERMEQNLQLCNAGELTPDSMRHLWKVYQKYGNVSA
ncbi:UDP-GalNAc:beta-1,3-N-acetylgalactosaminyltransferase 2-like isoform X1 [Schistocerca americana]|uniref:UDP-GalNAc:beta-1, 3-N-acetylgalactosaminyltransferase 2-like isoform X1 n=1 Tax=Schistocerca americana TaxID=7009 RepID=UPI001F4FFC08|nr:UDP-GalNAc:beta-1,3-N-acetylgalactosaminyltransferase 2-like isoform X1 [Schistocerca americana]